MHWNKKIDLILTVKKPQTYFKKIIKDVTEYFDTF